MFYANVYEMCNSLLRNPISQINKFLNSGTVSKSWLLHLISSAALNSAYFIVVLRAIYNM